MESSKFISLGIETNFLGYDKFVGAFRGWIGGVEGDEKGICAGASNLGFDGTQNNHIGSKWSIQVSCYAASQFVEQGLYG